MSVTPKTENGSKPAEIFRKDLISAMKLPDGHTLQPEEYHVLTDPWKPEWERGVQVCVNDQLSLKPHVRRINNSQKKKDRHAKFTLPKQRIKATTPHKSEPTYDLDQMDLCWLKFVNRKHKGTSHGTIGLDCFETAITKLELECHRKFVNAIATDKGLGIEYDASIPCDVCGETDGEELNEMIFCDVCNLCVHQACYGIQVIPDGPWLCRPCMQSIQSPQCVLCPNRGGAMKPVRFRSQWCHVRCALWIPEVGVGNVDKMEPITKTELIPQSRWNLLCIICREKQGACIQCSIKSCAVSYHVTCAVKASLYMKTILDTSHNKLGHVRHVSHCPKHTKELSPGLPSSCSLRSEMTIGNVRESRLKSLEENVHTLMSPNDVVDAVKVSRYVASLLYNYWKMKRKAQAQGNRSLLDLPDPRKEAEELKRRNKTTALTGDPNWEAHAQQKIDLEKFLTLRTDMEKARNLSYMLIRREKQKRECLLVHQTVSEKRCQLALEEAQLEEEKSKQRQKAEIVKARRCSAKEWTNHRSRKPGGDDGPTGGRVGGLGWNGLRLRPRTLAQQSRERKSGQKRDGGGSENEMRCVRHGESELVATDALDGKTPSALKTSVQSVRKQTLSSSSDELGFPHVPVPDPEVGADRTSGVRIATRKRKSGVSCDELLVDNLRERASLEAIVNCLKFKHAHLIEESLGGQQDGVIFDINQLQEAVQKEKSVRSWISRASQVLNDYEAQLNETPALKIACNLQGEFERLVQCAFPRHSAHLLRDVERDRKQRARSKRRCLNSLDHALSSRTEEHSDDPLLYSLLLTPRDTPEDSPSSRRGLSSPVLDVSLPLSQIPSPASSDELVVVV